MSLIIGKGFGGNDPERRRSQVTARELEESGTLRWRRELGDGWEISHYGCRGGRAMLKSDGRYTTVPLSDSEADGALADAGELASLVARMRDRIDSNAEAAAMRRKKAGFVTAEGYADPVDALAVADPADSNASMLTYKQLIAEALGEMTPKQADTWVKCALLGYTMAEVARERGVTPQSVFEQYRRAEKAMLAKFRDGFGQ